jgi:amidohydrolase
MISKGLRFYPESEEIAVARKLLDAKVEKLSGRMIEMNDWMYSNPESGFLEFKASKMLTDELRKQGFEVEMGVPGLDDVWPEFERLKYVGGLTRDYDGPPGIPTAFKAKYKGKSEPPVIAILVEYDALRANPPFHGCCHNLKGPMGVGAAVAVAKMMEWKGIPGSIWVIGCPAEEVGPGTKVAQVRAGYFDGIDFAMMSSGKAVDNMTLRIPGGISRRHIEKMKYTFHGRSGHAQQPWQGRSALDAVMLLFHALEIMREHSEPQFRLHGYVSDGGTAPNMVADLASATIWVRHLIDETPLGSVSPKKARQMVMAKVEEVNSAARGVAMATGCTVDIENYDSAKPGIVMGSYNDLSYDYAVFYGATNLREETVPEHWEETGFVSVVVPGVQIRMGYPGLPPAGEHSHENADMTISPLGHGLLVSSAKITAAVALRLAMDKQVREKIKAEYDTLLKKYNE